MRVEADRTEVLLLTSLTPYCKATPAHYRRDIAHNIYRGRNDKVAGCSAEGRQHTSVTWGKKQDGWLFCRRKITHIINRGRNDQMTDSSMEGS